MLARCGGGEPGNITTAVRSRVGLGCWMISSGITRSRGRWARSRSGVGGWTSIEMEILGGVGLRLLLEPELLVVLSLEKLVGVGESVSDSGWLISIVTWWFSLLGFYKGGQTKRKIERLGRTWTTAREKLLTLYPA